MKLDSFKGDANTEKYIHSEEIEKLYVDDATFDPDDMLDDRVEVTYRVTTEGYYLIDDYDPDEMLDEVKGTPLTEEDRVKLKEETQWSDEIINSIQTKEEAEVLKNAKVHEEEINGKKCLVRDDIDMNQVDSDGLTNRQRMESGKAPIDKDGNKVELHHIGQRKDSPLAELNSIEHDNIPNPNESSDVHKDENAWRNERKNHWKSRAEE